MTWGNPPPIKVTRSKAKLIQPEDIAKTSEDSQQAAFFCWCGLNRSKYECLKWIHAIPNGGSRHIAEAIKMVSTGLRGGVLDIFLPVPIQTDKLYINDFKDGYNYKRCAGLYIEMKAEKRRNHKDGGLEPDQIEFIKFARDMGYYVAVCYNWQEARDIVIKYLEGKL